jgi:hypothetical protein
MDNKDYNHCTTFQFPSASRNSSPSETMSITSRDRSTISNTSSQSTIISSSEFTFHHEPSFIKNSSPASDFQSENLTSSTNNENNTISLYSNSYKSKNNLLQSKTIDILTVYMLERFLEKEFKEKFNISNPKFEQDFIESIQNIIIYINLKLINYNDIAIEYGEIKKVNKTIIKDGVFVYDVDNYPIYCKKIRRNSLSHRERTNSKLKSILTCRYSH